MHVSTSYKTSELLRFSTRRLQTPLTIYMYTLINLNTIAVTFPMVVHRDFSFYQFFNLRAFRNINTPNVSNGLERLVSIVSSPQSHRDRWFPRVINEIDKARQDALPDAKRGRIIVNPGGVCAFG